MAELVERGAPLRWVLKVLDRIASKFGRTSDDPKHLETGRRGEEEAFFHLRAEGYVVIARNWRTPRRRGELDIVAWDGDALCFVEVKTRSERSMVPAEMAVDQRKQDELRGMARAFLRRHPPETKSRFDVVSVYLVPGEPADVTLLKDAFGWRSMRARRRR